MFRCQVQVVFLSHISRYIWCVIYVDFSNLLQHDKCVTQMESELYEAIGIDEIGDALLSVPR